MKVDAGALERLTRVAAKVSVDCRGMTAKNRERLRAFNDEDAVQAFLTLPARLREMADAGTLKPRRAAILAQMAVAIEILQMAPIRRQNLAELELGRDLKSLGGRTYLIVPSHRVKNNTTLDFELPEETVALIDWYVAKHRPALLNQSCDALFPGRSGGPKAKQTLGMQITDTVFKYTGLRVNTHLFRHVGAKLYLDARPGEYEPLRRLLGHRSIATTTGYYTGAETAQAVKRFDDVIGERRHRRHSERDARGPTDVARTIGRRRPEASDPAAALSASGRRRQVQR